jgi:hypothetical protein
MHIIILFVDWSQQIAGLRRIISFRGLRVDLSTPPPTPERIAALQRTDAEGHLRKFTDVMTPQLGGSSQTGDLLPRRRHRRCEQGLDGRGRL